MENLKVISSRFETAKADFAKIKNKYLKKQPLELKTFDEFLESK